MREKYIVDLKLLKFEKMFVCKQLWKSSIIMYWKATFTYGLFIFYADSYIYIAF